MEKKRVLIVDDEEDVTQTVLRKVLVQYKEIYEPIIATDGYEALDSMRQKHVDVVLLDINMRNLDGVSVCRHAKKDASLRDIPIIVTSGFINEYDKEELRKIGIRYFLDKPYSIDQLFDMIHSILN